MHLKKKIYPLDSKWNKNKNCQIVKRKTYKCKLHEKSTLNYLDMQLGKIIKHSNIHSVEFTYFT